MKSSILLLIFFVCTNYVARAQVAINTTNSNPHNSAMLDIASTSKGVLVPRMTTAQRTAIASPATGLLVYDSDLSLFYYYNAAWMPILTSTTGWGVNGNSGTVSGTNFIGTTNNQHFDIRTNNVLRTRIRTTGQIEVFNTGSSVYLGDRAGINDDLNSRQNVGIGERALTANTSGGKNTAIGFTAMASNTTGSFNTALGGQSMLFNTSGNFNVAVGEATLQVNTTGVNNVAVSYNSLGNNVTGSNNIAIGLHTLASNTTGSNNTAIGYLANVTSGNLTNATAIGYNARVSQSNSIVLGAPGAGAVNVGIGITAPLSGLDINGTIGLNVKNGLTAGVSIDNPDNRATVWVYTTGTGNITLPAANTVASRVYFIYNRSGSLLNISPFSNLAGATQSTLPTATSILIVSDGTTWLQLK